MKLRFLRHKFGVIALVVLGFFVAIPSVMAASANQSLTPAGYWQTVDHDTNKPSSIIKIWKNKSGTYDGKIHFIYSEAGHKTTDVCRKCKGALRNRPILGMQIIRHFKATDDPTFYNSGRIMDPTNGKTYKCHLTLKENGQVLDVHGYIGIPLFGRSDIWYRVHPVKR